MIPFSRRRIGTTTGLDIGSRFIKLVAVDHSGIRPEIVRVVLEPAPPGAMADGEVVDCAAVASVIRSAVKAAGLARTQLVAAIGGPDVIVKKIAMDRLDESDARDAIRWDAREHVPFDLESVQLDFQILNPDSDAPRMSVLLVAAKRELVERRLALLARAGLEPDVLEVDAFALHNALECNHPDAMQGFVALVDVGHDVTRLELLTDGAPALVRNIPFGTRRLGEELSRATEIDPQRQQAAMAGRDGAPALRELLRERAGELVDAVGRAVAFVAQGDAPPLGRAFICGGGARVPGMLDAFAAGLGVRTEATNPVQRIPVRPDAAAAVALEEVAPLLTLPVGLALRRSREVSRARSS